MKILTYNIWNAEREFDKRLELLCKVILSCDADIIALQEVKNEEVVDYLKFNCKYQYSLWKKYCGYDEGLAILSRYPIIFNATNWESKKITHNSSVLRTVIACNNKSIGITNLHLDYESALNREIGILETVMMVEKGGKCDYELMLGDFNASPESSVYRYLTGQQSLSNYSTNWIDLHKAYASKKGIIARATLDFYNNPRWDDENTIELPERFDYIMLKSPYPKKNPILKSVEIIGDIREFNITPSDHYGVMCDIEFNQI